MNCEVFTITYTHKHIFIRLALWGGPEQGKVLFCKRYFGVLLTVIISLFSCLLISFFFSMVELEDGRIEIDGYNVRSVSLDVLRKGLALVPQDSTLFFGTLRENL